MITDILIAYYVFSVLFMIGYIDTSKENITIKIVIYTITLLVSPILLPINIGYYIHKNS